MSEPGQTPQEAALAAQKRRNVWLGLALGGFVVLVGIVSALRLAANLSVQV